MRPPLTSAWDRLAGIGETWRGHFMDAVDRGGKGQPEKERGRMEVEQGMAMMTGEPLVTNGAAGTQASADQSYNANQASYGGSAVGNDQGYVGGVAGAEGNMPLAAGLGAGAGGAYPEAQYAAANGYNSGIDQPNRMGGRNDREFEGYRNTEGPEQNIHPEGTGPAPDRTYTGPDTGVPSSGIQRLP
jgi:hypothetical protein